MSVMNYVSSEIKIIAVKHSLVGTESLNQSAARFGVSRSTLQKWLLNYEMFGTEGLCHRAGNHHYSKEIKREAVEAYLSGRMSEEEICKKYQIRSRTQLEKWVSLYNGQKEFRPAGRARKGTCMARISGEEKEKAVEFCIAHDRDYALTAEHFGFTYQQIYGGCGSITRRVSTVCERIGSAPENFPTGSLRISISKRSILSWKWRLCCIGSFSSTDTKAAVRRISAACGRLPRIRPSKNCMRNTDGLFISSALR